MNRNELVKKLVAEGMSQKTLVNMNDKQLGLLASRILSEETLMISKKSPTFNQDIAVAKKANKTIETYEQKEPCECEKTEMKEEKPSAGLSSKKKTAIVKKAKSGGDIGKKGKGFEKVVAAAKKGGAKDPKAVAAAAMWKNVPREGEQKESDVDESARTLGFGYHGGLKSKKIFKAGNKRGKAGEPYATNVNEWVEGLVKENYTPMTTKGDITKMIKQKLLSEQMENSKLPLDTEDCVYADGVSMDQSVAQKIANSNAKAKFVGKFPEQLFSKIVETAHRTKDNHYRYIVGLKVRNEAGQDGEVDEPYVKDNKQQGDLKEQNVMASNPKVTSNALPEWMKKSSIEKSQFAPTEVPTKTPTKVPTKSPNKVPRTPYNPGKGTNPNPKAKY